MSRMFTFAILVSLWSCSAPFRPAPAPSPEVDLDAGVDLDADAIHDTAPTYPTCGEYFVIETDGAVTKLEWGPCHT